MTSHSTSGLGMGCNKLGSAAAGLSRRAAVRLVHEATDTGITFFDTADVYGGGTSEQLIGAAVHDRRSRVQIATKGGYQFAERNRLEQAARGMAAPLVQRLRRLRGGEMSASAPSAPAAAYATQRFDSAYLDAALSSSLRRLRTDYVDVYQLHGPQVADIDAFAQFAERARAGGRVRSFGVGLNDLDEALQWIQVPGVEAIQLPIGILDPDAAATIIPQAEANGIRIIARGIFGAGLLSPRRLPDELRVTTDKWPVIADVHAVAASVGVSAVQLAAWYVRAHAPQAQWIVGINTAAQLHDTVATFAAPMPQPEVLAQLQAVIDRYPLLLSSQRGAADE